MADSHYGTEVTVTLVCSSGSLLFLTLQSVPALLRLPQVMSVTEHAAARRQEAQEGGEHASTSVQVEAEEEGGDYTSILLPVDSKERRVVLRRVSHRHLSRGAN